MKRLSVFSLLSIFVFAAGLICSPLAFAQTGDLDEAAEERYAKDETTEINVKNADIAAIVRIFSKRTKRNYILDERVKGKVSIYLPGRVSAAESVKILDSVLTLKGFASVPIGDNLWKIVPAKEAKQSTIPTLTEDDTDAEQAASMVTRLVTLKFVGADEIKQLLSPLVSSDGLMNAYTGTNSLILIDNPENITRLVEIIATIDVPFTNREMTIIPVEHAEAPEIAEKLAEILGEDEEASGEDAPTSRLDLIRARLRESRSPNANNKNAAATDDAFATTVAARTRPPKIIADERTNSIIVVADDETTARIRALIAQLDSEVDLSGNRFYVYRCQHASAEELAEVLAGLSGEGVSSSRTNSSSSSSGLFSNSSSRNTGSLNRGSRFSSTQSRLSGQQRTPGRSRSEGSSGSSGPTSVSLGENVSVTADPSTNSLIIHASKTDYEKLKELLQQLDVKRRQVLVEAMLLEVGVDSTTTLGTDFLTSAGGDDGGVFSSSNFTGNLTTLLSDPTQLSNFSAAAASSGTLTLPGDITIPTQTVLLSAARNNSNVNVLSAPTILATDNEQAEIVVGQNVPFLASTATSGDNLNNTFNQIDRQDVGITLRLTPQISSENFVTLQIFTEVSNVIDSTANSELGPTTTIRTSETSVITRDSQMVVIGGLIVDDINEAESGVPFLQDLPVLGHLFRATTERQRRNNLLIFITPRIVKDQFDARDVTIERRETLEDEIARRSIVPPRDDVLHDSSIDHVTELVESDEDDKPGTILPPAPPKIVRKGRIGETATEEQAAPAKADKEVISLRIQPKFVEKDDDSQKSFIVFQVVERPANIDSFPFQIPVGESYVGVAIPEGAAGKALSFFESGQLFRYASGEQGMTLSALGAFSSTTEAEQIIGDSKPHWHTLSPYEIMNLGVEPWSKVP